MTPTPRPEHAWTRLPSGWSVCTACRSRKPPVGWLRQYPCRPWLARPLAVSPWRPVRAVARSRGLPRQAGSGLPIRPTARVPRLLA